MSDTSSYETDSDSEYIYKDGKKISFFSNGNIKNITEYRDNKIILYQRFYSNGNPRSQVDYEDDGLENIKTFYLNGKRKKIESMYFNTEKSLQCKHGLKIKWFENGNVKMSGKYYKNIPIAPIEEWYSNGCRKSIFETDSENYKRIVWYDNGNISQTEICYQDVTSYFFWYPNGKINSFGEFKNAKRDGIWEFWSEDGNKIKEEYYKDGISIKYNGIWTRRIDDDINYASYVKDGVRNGKAFFYLNNGRILIDFFYQDGFIHGKYTEYDYDGNIYLSVNYINNMKNGPLKYFYRNELVAEYNYVDDVLHGPFIYQKDTNLTIFYTYNKGELMNTITEIYKDKTGIVVETSGKHNKGIPYGHWVIKVNGEYYKTEDYGELIL